MSDSRSSNPADGLYGGQALIEGVMIRARTGIAIAVRSPQGAIVRHSQPLPGFSRYRLRKIPFLRGIPILLESVVAGARALTYSTSIAYAEETDQAAPRTSGAADKILVILTYTLAVLLAIALFLVLPVVATNWIGTEGGLGILANFVEGLIRVALLLGYIAAIGLIKDVKRMYGYHGAEHKAIAAAEAGAQLSPEQVLTFAKEHPRCGTAFLITIGILGIVLLSFTPREPLWVLVGVRVALIPLVMAIGYELIRFASLRSSNPVARVLNAPNLLAQKLTTRQPDAGMVEVAIAALQHAQNMDAPQSDRSEPAV